MENLNKVSEELCDEHWGFVCGLLSAHGVDPGEIRACEYHYRTAWRHAWKHCLAIVAGGDTVGGWPAVDGSPYDSGYIQINDER